MKPKVYFVGAGPGDSELITMKAVRILRETKVVLYDRLVNPEILELYVPEDTKRISVGKQGYKCKSLPQSEINRILLKEAQENISVVRLKGGDTSIFSNIYDELMILRDNNIDYEIVPGITAASGMSATTSIPLTARDMSRGVRYLAYLGKEEIPESSWEDFAKTTDTLVFYMSLNRATTIFEKLLSYECNKPFAIIQNATLGSQKVLVSELNKYSTLELPDHNSGPALIVIGEVVRMYDKFSWFLPNNSTREVFLNL